MVNEQFLEHIGILGMKWGHKKGPSSTSVQKNPSHENHNSEDYQKKIDLKGKKMNEMSNEELRAYTQRSLLEKQYKELSKADVSRGKKFVDEFVSSTTKQVISKLSAKAAEKMVEKILKKTAKD